MTALIAEYFSPILKNHLNERTALGLSDFINAKGIKDTGLLEEFIVILRKNKFIKRKDDKIWLLKSIPNDIVEQTQNKLDRLTRESFQTFAKYTKTAIEDRLLGTPLSEFDSGELRLQWDIALRGDFYRYQRNRAFEFIKFKKILAEKKESINILDYGCGSGDGTIQIYNYVQNIIKEFNLEAYDVSEGLIAIAEEDDAVGLPINFFSLNKQKPKSNFYDFIFVSQVFHWHKNPTELIAELKSYLKPNGLIFGVQSTISESIYYIDLFIRLLGAQGFPVISTLYSWFKANNLALTFDPVFYSFKGEKKT